MNRTVWIRADLGPDRDARKRILTTALENDLLNIVVLEEDLDTFRKLGRFEPISIIDGDIISGKERGTFVTISGKDDEQRASSMAGKVDMVVICVEDWKVIPLENLIASFQGSGTKLMAQVRDLSDVPLFFGALEHGVDGIVLDPDTPERIVQLRTLLDSHGSEVVGLADASIVEIRNLGMGDRVCIDTCSLLRIGEGMLIGSQSSGLFLVHSESVGSEYVGTRPFRVNAGPVQSYVLGPGDRTPYLSDLRVGDEVLAVDRNGSTRPVIIGRLKVERRPLMLISAELDSKIFNIILQNAETVRLISGGEPVSLVDLKVGDPVKVLTSEGGRHFGTRVKETIIEK